MTFLKYFNEIYFSFLT